MKRLLKILSFGGIALLVAVLIAASLLGRIYGSSFAIDNIYHSVWFIALWAVTAVAGMVYIMRVSRRATLVVLHTSFVVVLLGAFTSFLTSRHGEISIAQDTVPASMFEMPDGTLEKLPFRLQLASIETVGLVSDDVPSDYIAHIVADDRSGQAMYVVSLNSPAIIKGYQFCIKGVADGALSLLVSYDTYGRKISYVGYLMVFLSFVMLFFDRKSGFTALLYKLKARANERNAKSALAFYSECSRGSSARSAVKGENDKVKDCTNEFSAFRFPFSAFMVLLCLLWYGRGVFPATNGAEVLMLLALSVALLAVALGRKGQFALLRRALLVVAGVFFVIAVCSLDGGGDVQPILRTPLLGVHVITIIIAYALLACAAVNAVIALCTKDSRRRVTQALLGRLLLYPATMLLATGIFIGAVWANLSWGRYWGWDPKEVWALVTLLVCSVAFHTRSLSFMARPVVFHIFCIVAFVAVLFTYFGVNYLFGGLHSYA